MFISDIVLTPPLRYLERVEKFPKSSDLLIPLLEALQSGSVLNNQQIRNHVSQALSLTQEQLDYIHSGSRSEFEYRLAWARTSAKSKGLIQSPKRNFWQITELGKLNYRNSVAN
jgi:restriction system protein